MSKGLLGRSQNRRTRLSLFSWCAAIALLGSSTAPLAAQVTWSQRSFVSLFQPGLAFAANRGRTVLFGCYHRGSLQDVTLTMEWDGRDWVTLTPATSPPWREYPALAYDPVRGRVVLFGGWDAGFNVLNDTWEWDGNTWTQRFPTTSPPGRIQHAMAYDTSRSRLVLFGGNASGFVNDTWEWDGSNWAQRTPATRPAVRAFHTLAYDAARARVVLFGGQTSGANDLDDTWEWNGTTWTQRTPTTKPSARSGQAMAYDSTRARVVLCGALSGGLPNDTWEWDGSTWSKRSPVASPVQSGVMAFDSVRARMVMYGNDTWEYDGSNWFGRIPPTTNPPERGGHAVAYDSGRGVVVLFSGLNGAADTWEWSGSKWTQRFPVVSPPARFAHAMAYDPVRQRTVLYGGNTTGTGVGFLGDTWEWDGNNWTKLSPFNSPPLRRDHALVYDAARGRVVLFGGNNTGFNPTNDTWEWNGNNWTQRSPATVPPARSQHKMAYDAVRGRIVLFGGQTLTGSYLGDTWEWDGNNWIARAPASSPSGRFRHAMAFDPSRGRTVLVGGANASGAVDETWEWDGGSWTRRAPLVTAGNRGYHAVAFDSRRGRVVMLGGYEQGAFEPSPVVHEYVVLADVLGAGHSSGSLPLSVTSPPLSPGQLCVSVPSSLGNAMLLLSVGDCSLPPLPINLPFLCRNPMFVFPNPATWLTFAMPGSPGVACFPIPDLPELANVSACLQALSLQAGNCALASDGLIVRIRRD